MEMDSGETAKMQCMKKGLLHELLNAVPLLVVFLQHTFHTFQGIKQFQV